LRQSNLSEITLLTVPVHAQVKSIKGHSFLIAFVIVIISIDLWIANPLATVMGSKTSLWLLTQTLRENF